MGRYGRTANNISAVLITNFSIALLVSDDRFATVISALVLFMAVSVVMFVYINRRNNVIKNTLADKSINKSRGEYSQKFAESFSLTQREHEVFERLISPKRVCRKWRMPFICRVAPCSDILRRFMKKQGRSPARPIPVLCRLCGRTTNLRMKSLYAQSIVSTFRL